MELQYTVRSCSRLAIDETLTRSDGSTVVAPVMGVCLELVSERGSIMLRQPVSDIVAVEALYPAGTVVTLTLAPASEAE
jgi:hypothetical protein